MSMPELIRWTPSVPVVMSCDVCVLGGGPAGLTAAISAAREGKKTVLVERLGALGGTAAMGFVVPISGFFHKGERVVGGIAWEMVERLKEENAAIVEYPKGHVSFHPETYKLVAQRMCLESGVTLMMNTTFCGCLVRENRITHVIVQSKNGMEAVEAQCFIDATGEADLCRRAGVPMMDVPETCQPMSLCFVLEGVDTASDLMKDCIHHTGANGSHSVNSRIHDYLNECVVRGELEQFGGPWFNSLVQGNGLSVNITRRAGDAADRASMLQTECLLREDMFRIVALLRREYPEFKHASIVASGVNAGVRETRRIQGLEMVTGADMIAGKEYPCPVARCAHPIDMHDAKSSAQSLNYFDSAAYVPHTALIPQKIDNMLAAGRCICADAKAYASLRVQATLMSVGEAAGVMAAFLCQEGGGFAALDAKPLDAKLRDRGIIPTR